MTTTHPSTHRELLIRQRLVFVEGDGPVQSEAVMRGVDLQLATLGYALSRRLRDRLASTPLDAIAEKLGWLWATLAAHTGQDRNHTPLFRRFPHDVPADLDTLWLTRMRAHFAQAPDQPCLTCDRVGTTHVLAPCHHVVCDACFDANQYAGCPVCGRHVDLGAPYFRRETMALRDVPKEPVRFTLLDLGTDAAEAAADWARSLLARKQPLSPADVDTLKALVSEQGAAALDWLPAKVPVRETVAHVFAALERAGVAVPEDVAARHMTSATDLLRFLAAVSGADPALQGDTAWRVQPDGSSVQNTFKRFRVARLPRSRRRRFLALLEGMDEETLHTDMGRHRAYWVWVGEFLHPGEYAERFPKVARAFAVVRKQAEDGTKAPPFRGRASRLEAAILRRDADALIGLLAERPGELARRLDQSLRIVAEEPAATDKLVAAFASRVADCQTPVLLTLYAHLPHRAAPATGRVYWPKGASARGVWDADRRPPLAPATIDATHRAVEAELLRRFAAQGTVQDAIVDLALADIVAPFNERTAARSAIALPRGSRVALPEGRMLRLFLHWCQPPGGGHTTDLDLSVAFYDAAWGHVGVCSYYQLEFVKGFQRIATSSGDYTDAPHPDGASEFIDLDRTRAHEAGIRYAVMLVNAYAGLPFDRLERAFAGIMGRDDGMGPVFDPTTVALKFALAGQHGVYMPIVVDLEEGVLHWLDVHAKGEFQMNNAKTSQKDVTTVCPTLMAYFESGVRPSMRDLALLHAAARAERVYMRGAPTRLFERGDDPPAAFLARLRAAQGGTVVSTVPTAEGRSRLAFLHRGDLALPDQTPRYCLFPDQVGGTMAASDLLS